jgi:hypothetical protein
MHALPRVPIARAAAIALLAALLTVLATLALAGSLSSLGSAQAPGFKSTSLPAAVKSPTPRAGSGSTLFTTSPFGANPLTMPEGSQPSAG